MNDIKSRAIELRKEGKTYGEISRELGIPKGTLSGWFSGSKWSKEVTKRWIESTGRKQIGILNERRNIAIETRNNQVTRQALHEFTRYELESLFAAGLALYWGEGDKRTRYQVRITNTDPGIIKAFLHFLLSYANINKEKIWVSLIIYEDLNKDECEEFWKKETGLGIEHFQKTVTIRSRNSLKKSPYGICVLGVSSVVLKIKMLVWIAELSKRL